MTARHIRLAVCLLLFLGGWPFLGMEPSVQFVEVTSDAGLRKPLDGIMAHAAAWGDFDGDGDLDLYVGGFADRPDAEYAPAWGPPRNQLFRNTGNGRFERVASPAVEFYGRTSSAVFVDLDNDGVLDLYVANNARPSSILPPGRRRDAQVIGSRLFRNSAGTFADVSDTAGACVAKAGSARGVGVLDYDTDGLLDLLVVEDRFGAEPPRTRLCRNLGDFRFADVTRQAGLPGDVFGLGVAIGDVNDDGRPDIFVAHSNRFFISASPGRYIEPASLKALAWKSKDAEDWPAGAAFGDLNRDGRLDLVLGIHHDRASNRVYLNAGQDHGVPVMRDVSADAGLPPQLRTKSPHVEIQDFDNDGWPDVYFSAAWIDTRDRVTPLVFRNLGAHEGRPRLAAVRQLSGGTPGAYFPAGPSADYDGDGRIDLFLANWFRGNYSRLLRNSSGGNGWLAVTVAGGKNVNRMGIGAKVSVYKAGELNRAAGLLGYQEIGTGYGFSSGQPAVAHFGLGGSDRVDVRVVLPGGKEITRTGVPAGQRLTVATP